MKSRGLVVLLLIVASCYFVLGNPLPSAKITEITTTTPKPWLRFLKDKKTTPVPITEIPKQEKNVPVVNPTLPLHPASVTRAVGAPPTPIPTADQFLNSLIAYFQPSSPQYQYPPVLAQDKKLNPDTMYDELYLDWMKRSAEPEPQAPFSQPLPPASGYPAAAAAPVDSSYPGGYMYPAMALPYSPYFPLAGLKVQKAMAQAQFDAALTAMNITTTPKPIKLKLKIMVPGGTDLSQIAAITNNLPPGSTFALD